MNKWKDGRKESAIEWKRRKSSHKDDGSSHHARGAVSGCEDWVVTGSGHHLAGNWSETESKEVDAVRRKTDYSNIRLKRRGETQQYKSGKWAWRLCQFVSAVPIGRCLGKLKRVKTESNQGIGLGWTGRHVFSIAGRKERRFPVDMGRFIYSTFSVITPTHVDCITKFNWVMN